jgi:amidase
VPLAPLSDDDVARIASEYGLHFDGQDIASFRRLAADLLTSYDEVERRHEASQPEPPSRQWRRPPDAENPLGAWYVTADIQARRDGPLAGRRVAVKDNIAVAGLPMMNGSTAVEGFVPRRDATVVARLLDAGAVIAGKAVCENLCFSGGSHTAATGPVRNPWDRSRSAGGSSSGSAALVAAGQADLALGGDQGGSIRIPAAYCGVVGHKPTHGLVPYTGAFPIENTLDHLGPITRTVRDAALMLGVLAGPDGLDPRQGAGWQPGGSHGHSTFLADLDAGVDGLRIGVLAEGFAVPGLSDPAVDDAVRSAIATLAGAGARVSEVSVPWHRDAMSVWMVIATDGVVGQMIDGDAFGMNWRGRYDPDLMDHYRRGRMNRADELPESVKVAILAGRHVLDGHGGRYYAMASNLALDLTAAYDAALATVDALVLPTMVTTALPLPAPDDAREQRLAGTTEHAIVNTAPFDVTGHPATSVPCGLVDGLPAGLMIVGRHLDDATCLRVARALEAAVGGFPAPPAGRDPATAVGLGLRYPMKPPGRPAERA